ncbi:MAG: Gfo/Idh/MocA family oxidoreductase [Firmicutes bacterium]|nr:Gfo/Idh/MocA family oxidoreductase [Bacillota bacterium]
MKMIRVLLVAVGGYGRNYVERLIGDACPEDVRVVGIADPMAEKARDWELIQASGIPVYNTPDEFYAEHEADLAIISAPIHLHAPLTITCLRHGSFVLCEKPAAPTASEARAMLQASQETGLWVAIGYQLSFTTQMQAIKKDLLAGVYGAPVHFKTLHSMRRGLRYYRRNSWAGKVNVGGHPVNDSPFANACAHQFHNMLFLLGDTMYTAAPVNLVKAELYRGNPNVENFDTVALEAQDPRGFRVSYYTSHPMNIRNIGPLSEFICEKGTIYHYEDTEDLVGVLADGRRIEYKVVPDEGFKKLYDVLDCVRTGTKPVCTIETALPHACIVDALSKLPIRPAKAELYEEDGEMFYGISGLEEAFHESFRRGVLPSEAGFQL